MIMNSIRMRTTTYDDSDEPGDINNYHQEDWEEEDEFESSGRHQLSMPRWEPKVWKSLASVYEFVL
jgi:hypothetical protein